MATNPYLLAADNPTALLALLRESPSLASGQDEHGYSLVHAAASYNHLDLLRALSRDFQVNVNLRDEDDETALFVVETVDAAKVLVEELGADLLAKNGSGQTAREKILEEADFPEVAEYLKTAERDQGGDLPNGNSTDGQTEGLPPPPEGMTVSVGTMAPVEENEGEIDPEFRRRIEELAERDDFHTEAGQAELRQLVQDAISDRNLADRNVRQRQD
ncbi:hypothetical protein JX266_007155 [Neoarthrinium moseri]|uniref:uncharacterized protein n=1 Tax=Neoarthrinium moseri TaxID=1658444 RepID=UPI001FDC082B|nr:uncharacterized protein JN550_003592 [Neoarthrinium moseri]KAI1846934.1 hypothetical protein JX266_007155 [Neoarthrinium moseri]KAI1872718.1 hypothetical protein JN550_003592 [Neoarthrinium moseri]